MKKTFLSVWRHLPIALVLACVTGLYAEETPATAEAAAFSLAQDWRFTAADSKELPHGNHVGGLLESYFQPAILSNPDTAGFARAENVQIAMLGESTRWQRWYLGGANISHPGRPGEPLIYMPLSMLSAVSAQKYAVANTAKNGIHLSALPAEEQRNTVQLSMPLQIGGMGFIPRKTADREPASDWGAPESSRGFAAASAEGFATYVIRAAEKPIVALTADAYYARRNFNNLAKAENAGEFTLLGAIKPEWIKGDQLNLLVQGRGRGNLGSEYYFPESQTLQSNQLSLLGQYNFSSDKAEGALAFGYSYRTLSLRGNELTRSLTDQLIMAPAIVPKTSHTAFIDGSGFKKTKFDIADIEYGINSRFEWERVAETPPGNRLNETLFAAAYGATVFDRASVVYNALLRWQPFLRALRRRARSEITGSAGGHIDWGLTDAGSKVGFVHPAASLGAKTFIGSTGFFVGGTVLHDTMGFTLQEVSYLNRDSLSGTRYSWNDANGNGSVDAGELTNPTRTGGAYHYAQRNLQAPQKEELNVSFGFDTLKDWRFEINFNGRMYRKLFEVRYADGTSPQFTPSSAGANAVTYDRTQGGNEVYELRNAEKDAYYAHAEITVAKTRRDSDWIFRFSVGGYYGAGYSPQGLGAFYNDPGVYNETTADPNFRENRFGRLDNDRGYIGKLIFGRRFAKVFSVTNVIRYRDGEATAGYKVVTGLAQGPIVVPFEERGGGLTGIGRYTYSLAWDLRLRFDTIFSGNAAWAFLDVFNLLNSRTELFEYPLAGTAYRDPVEQGTARTLRLGLGMSF